MSEPIHRHAQDFSHITAEQWAAMGPDFEKAQAEIMKKIEAGEYSPEFGEALKAEMMRKYEGFAGPRTASPEDELEEPYCIICAYCLQYDDDHKSDCEAPEGYESDARCAYCLETEDSEHMSDCEWANDPERGSPETVYDPLEPDAASAAGKVVVAQPEAEGELWLDEYEDDDAIPEDAECASCGDSSPPYRCRRCGDPTCGSCGRIPYDLDIDSFLCMGCEEAEADAMGSPTDESGPIEPKDGKVVRKPKGKGTKKASVMVRVAGADYMGTFETEHFTFTAFGRSPAHVRKLMRDAWKVHAKRTGAEPGYFRQYQEDLQVQEIVGGAVVEGGEIIYAEGDDAQEDIGGSLEPRASLEVERLIQRSVQEDDLDAALRPIQDALGIATGDNASIYWSGSGKPSDPAKLWPSASGEDRERFLRDYIDFEGRCAAGDYGGEPDPLEPEAGASGLTREARVATWLVKEVLDQFWAGKVPNPVYFERLLKENETGTADFFQGLGIYARNEGWPKEYVDKVAGFFSAWGYGPETYWIRAMAAGEPGVPGMPGRFKGKKPAPQKAESPGEVPETTDQPARQRPAQDPAKPQAPAAEPAKPAPAEPAKPAPAQPAAPAPVSGDIAQKIDQVRKMDQKTPPHRWRLVMRRKDTGEKVQTENVYTPRGLWASIKWLKAHPAMELVDMQDLGAAKLGSATARIVRTAGTAEEAIEKFKGGTPIIFTQDVELSFDALDAKGVIKTNMTGKIKKVLDSEYVIDIAGQIYKVPKSVAPHVMDIFVGSVVSQEHAGDDVVIDDISQAPLAAGEAPPSAPHAPGETPETIPAPPPEAMPQPMAGRVIGTIVVAEDRGGAHADGVLYYKGSTKHGPIEEMEHSRKERRAAFLRTSEGDGEGPDAPKEGVGDAAPRPEPVGPAPDVSYPDVDDLIYFNELALRFGGGGGASRFFPRYREILKSAIERPQQEVFGHVAFPTLPLKAAAMAHTMVTEHAFGDGNHRTTAITLRCFLEANGLAFPDAYGEWGTPESKELYTKIELLGTHEISLEQFAEWIASVTGDPSPELAAELAQINAIPLDESEDKEPEGTSTEVLPEPAEEIVIEDLPVKEPPKDLPKAEDISLPGEEKGKEKKAGRRRGKMLVTLSHEYNPDLEDKGGYWSDPVDPKEPREVAVNSLQEASKVCRDYIERNQLGSGNWTGGMVSEDGKQVARISYNGRIWPPGDWRPGMKPLADEGRDESGPLEAKSKGYAFFRRLQARAMMRSGKATIRDLNDEIDEKHDRNVMKRDDDFGKPVDKPAGKNIDRKHVAAGQRHTNAFQDLLDLIEKEAPYIPSEIGRRLYKGKVARDVSVRPHGGNAGA